jgi:hypothetical protein
MPFRRLYIRCENPALNDTALRWFDQHHCWPQLCDIRSMDGNSHPRKIQISLLLTSVDTAANDGST